MTIGEREDLSTVLKAIGSATVPDCRDRALLLLGFAGGFRRSELVGLDVSDFVRSAHGVAVTLRRSKTDQTAEGRLIDIPRERGRNCPVQAVERWLTASGIENGAMFRPVNRHGVISDARLSAEAVSLIIKQRVSAAGFDPTGFSGHSLRAGFVTSAVTDGVPTWKIRAQTGHKSDNMLARYIRKTQLFSHSGLSNLSQRQQGRR